MPEHLYCWIHALGLPYTYNLRRALPMAARKDGLLSDALSSTLPNAPRLPLFQLCKCVSAAGLIGWRSSQHFNAARKKKNVIEGMCKRCLRPAGPCTRLGWSTLVTTSAPATITQLWRDPRR